MELTVSLTEKELETAVIEYVQRRSADGISLAVTPKSVYFSTVPRDHNQGTETTARVTCEVTEK